jgi:hypothetical protein
MESLVTNQSILGKRTFYTQREVQEDYKEERPTPGKRARKGFMGGLQQLLEYTSLDQVPPEQLSVWKRHLQPGHKCRWGEQCWLQVQTPPAPILALFKDANSSAPQGRDNKGHGNPFRNRS